MHITIRHTTFTDNVRFLFILTTSESAITSRNVSLDKMEGSQPPGGPPQGQPNSGGAPYGHHPQTSYPSAYPPQQHPGASGGHMNAPPGGYPGYPGHAPPPGHGAPGAPGGYHPQMHPGQHPGYPGYPPRHGAPPGHMMHQQRAPVSIPQAPPAPQQAPAPITSEAETYDNPYTPQPSTPGTADNTASEAPSTPQTTPTDPAAQPQPSQPTTTQPAVQANPTGHPAQGAPQPGFPSQGQPGYPPHFQGGPHMQRPPMPRNYTTSPRYTAENLTAMQKALAEMQHQGLTKDPRYHQLVNAIRDAEVQLRRSTHSTFTPTQLSQLRAQIMAYKQLSRTQNIDPQLLQQVKGQSGQRPPGVSQGAQPAQQPQEASAPAQAATAKPEDGSEGDKSIPTASTPNPSDSRPSTAGPEKEESYEKENIEKKEPKQEPIEDEAKKNEPETPKAWTEGPPVQKNSDLYELLRDKRPGYGANKICPVQKPKGIDPAVVLEENEKRINARVLNRILELENLPATLPSDLRIRAQIELRSLRLLGFQRQLRQEIVSVTKQDTTLETALNTNAYRRKKKQGLKDARITEKIEKQHKTEGKMP